MYIEVTELLVVDPSDNVGFELIGVIFRIGDGDSWPRGV
jgi:hypothetical protein